MLKYQVENFRVEQKTGLRKLVLGDYYGWFHSRKKL